MNTPRENALVGRFSTYDSAVEIGVGRRPDVAVALVERGVEVTVTDVADADELDLPPSIRFVCDDVVAASERDDPGETYAADLLYGLNLPPELHRPTLEVARAVDADFLFTTLGYDSPAVPAETASLPEGETLYLARRRA
ncbi:MAG: UPF0146 family protein [Halobellus sp.]